MKKKNFITQALAALFLTLTAATAYSGNYYSIYKDGIITQAFSTNEIDSVKKIDADLLFYKGNVVIATVALADIDEIRLEDLDALNKSQWTITASSSWTSGQPEGLWTPENLLDDNRFTTWHSEPFGDTPGQFPYSFTIDMQTPKRLEGFYFVNRQGNDPNTPKYVVIEASQDGENYEPVYENEAFSQTRNRIKIDLEQPVIARYFNVLIISGYDEGTWYTYLAEIGAFSATETELPGILLSSTANAVPIGNDYTFQWTPDEEISGGYKVIFSKNDDFSEATEFTATTTSITLTAAQLATLKGEDEFPEIYWKVVPTDATQGVASNVFSFNLTAYHYVFQKIYPVGSAIAIGWHADQLIVHWDAENPGKYIWDGYMTAGEFKIHTEANFGGSVFRPLTADGSISSTTVQYTESGDDLKWLVQDSEAGYYRITLDMSDLTIHFDKIDVPASYYPLTVLFGQVNAGHVAGQLNDAAKIIAADAYPYVSLAPLGREIPAETTSAKIKFECKSNKASSTAKLFIYNANDYYGIISMFEPVPVFTIPQATEWTAVEVDISAALGVGFGQRVSDCIQFTPIDGRDNGDNWEGYEISIRKLRIEIE
jgi:hypothetical protein